MGNFLPILFAVAIILTVVTLVGHGIWVMLAALFGGGKRPRSSLRRTCPFCGQFTSTLDPRCDWCGRETNTPRSAELADLKAVERQLRRFRASGAMKPQAVDRLLLRLESYRQELIAPVVAKPQAKEVAAKPQAATPIVAELVEDKRPQLVVAAKPQAVTPVAKPAAAIPPVKPLPPPPPKKTWSETLAGFLQERSIRWAELVGVLVGGLLIVGSSLALVISFWGTLQETYLKFLVFVGYSSGIFGVGLFAYHRWKLHSTGRGLLVIATLLVPLNFVAIASLSPPETWGWPTAATVAVSLGVFAWLVTLAAVVLVPGRRWPTVLAVVGNSAALLLGIWLLDEHTADVALLAADLAPATLFAVAMAGYSWGQPVRRLQAADAVARFTLLGLAAFAGAVALGLLTARASEALDLRVSLYCLAPPLALAAWSVLATGLRIMRGMAKGGTSLSEAKGVVCPSLTPFASLRDVPPNENENGNENGDKSNSAERPEQSSLEAFRTAGAAVALLGAVLQLAALTLCWPQPLGLLVVGLVNAAGLIFVAVRHRLPVVHCGAMLCLAVAYLAGFHLLTNEPLRSLQSAEFVIHQSGLGMQMLKLFVGAPSATSLCGLFLTFAAIAAWFGLRAKNRHAAMYALGCGATAAVGVSAVTLLAIIGNRADALHAAAIYAFYGLACVLISVHRGLSQFSRRERDNQVRMLGRRENGTVPLATFSYVGWNLLAAAPFWPLQSPLLADSLSTAALAGCLFWLAVVWLLLAWQHRNAWLLAAQQCVLTAATVVAVTAWLQTTAWVASFPRDLLDPRSLQAYGIGLGVLSLLWIAARIGLGGIIARIGPIPSTPPTRQAACGFARASSAASVDRIVRNAVVWLQAILAAACVAPGVVQELNLRLLPPGPAAAAGPLAWLLLGVLAVVLIAALWEHWGAAEMVSSLLVAATVPCLVADHCAGQVAVASAMRWGLAACFLVCSVFVWQRHRLLPWSRLVKINIGSDTSPQLARATLLAITACPVIGLTLAAALLQLAGTRPGGPAAGSFFDGLGPNTSYLVPLALVIVGLVGYALRETSAGYAFSAGLVAEMTVILGYALSVVLDPSPTRTFGVHELVTLLQLATITAAAWAIAWLVARKWLDVWREAAEKGTVPDQPSVGARWNGPEGASHKWGLSPFLPAATLMNLQLGMGYLGNVVLVGVALTILALLHPHAAAWTIAAGSPLGWIALTAAVAAGVLRGGKGDSPHLCEAPSGPFRQMGTVPFSAPRWQRTKKGPTPSAVGLLGLTVIGLLACTVRGLELPAGTPIDPDWAYRVLMLGWAVFALLVALIMWWVASLRTLPDGEALGGKGDSPRPTSGRCPPERPGGCCAQMGTVPFSGEALGPPQALLRAAAVWVRIAAVAAVLLGLKAAFLHHGNMEECLWAAGTIAVASAAGATMAIWRRREGWAFAAALGVNVAASLVVWYFEQTRLLTFDQWWLRLVQANVIASSVVALVWLAAWKRLYELRELTVREGPFLGVQIALPVAANAVLLTAPVWRLVQSPTALPSWMGDLADAPGWVALLLCAAAAAWYLWQTMPAGLLNAVGGLMMAVGVLVACLASQFNPENFAGRPEYHTLTTAWAVAMFIVLGVGYLGRTLPWLHNAEGQSLCPAPLISGWVTFFGTAVVVLAVIHSPWDIDGAWWSIGAIASVSLAAAILALWLRLPIQVFCSGLLFNAIGVVAWLAWGQRSNTPELVQVNVLCLSAASAVWTALALLLPRSEPRFEQNGRPLAFSHLAAGLGLTAMLGLAARSLLCNMQAIPHETTTNLAWIALAAITLAILLTLWDRTARWTLCGLYLAGVTALVMLWDHEHPFRRELCWRAAADLAALILAAAIVGWLLGKGKRLWQALRIPDRAECQPHAEREEYNRWPTAWFQILQAVAAAIVASLCVWVAIDLTFDHIGDSYALFGLAGRMAGVSGTLMLLGAAIVMAWQAEPGWRMRWQFAAFAAGLLLSCCSGWAALDPIPGLPTGEAPWLHRSVTLLVSAAMMTLLSTFGLAKVLPKSGDWLVTARRAAPCFGGLTIATLALVLIQEGCLFDWNDWSRGTPMTPSAIAIVAATLVILAAMCIALAVAGGRKGGPLSAIPQAYVYAAEMLLVLVGLHLRMTMPWLFQLGIVEKYWMLIVMGVAFAGAGLSEFFHRRGLPVLSQPLERTALFLPLLPALGFWFAESDSVWGMVGSTPVLWFLMSAFYGSMAAMRAEKGTGGKGDCPRPTFGRCPPERPGGCFAQRGTVPLSAPFPPPALCAALAVLAANIGLWVALNRSGVEFFEHPQVWLIPIALAVLVAEYLNRDRLTNAQSAVFRYLGLSVIYVSSTADMFIAGLGHDWRLPLVLMLLSVAGVMAGVLLRIRSFLLLGIVFLLVDILAMIYHAAFDLQQTWILWVCGIALGAGIIALFAVFEKRRNDVVAVVEKLKQWER